MLYYYHCGLRTGVSGCAQHLCEIRTKHTDKHRSDRGREGLRIPAGDGRDSNGDFSAPHMYNEGVKIKTGVTGVSWVGVSVLLDRPG